MKFNSLIAGAILSGLVAGSAARAQDDATKKEEAPAKPAAKAAAKKNCKGKAMKKKKSCNGCDADHKAAEHKEGDAKAEPKADAPPAPKAE